MTNYYTHIIEFGDKYLIDYKQVIYYKNRKIQYIAKEERY